MDIKHLPLHGQSTVSSSTSASRVQAADPPSQEGPRWTARIQFSFPNSVSSFFLQSIVFAIVKRNKTCQQGQYE